MSRLIGGVLLLLLVAGGAAGCDRGREASAATDNDTNPSAEPIPDGNPIDGDTADSLTATDDELPFVGAVSGEPIETTLTLDSHLMVERNVGVTSRRDGVIEAIHVDRGDPVREGEPLASLESGDLLLSEKTVLLELEKEQSSFERARKLWDQKIIPSEEYETVRLRRDATEKSLERIRYELSKSIVRAPFDGVVSGRFVEKGQVIREDDRKTLFQVTALRPLLARVYIPEWALFGLNDRPARVAPTAGPVATLGEASGFKARLKWLSHVVDPASASVEALVEVIDTSADAASSGLRPGMSVRVDLNLTFGDSGSPAPLISLPREAFPDERPSPGDEIGLRVLDESGNVQYRTVRVGIVGDARVEIREGLEAGEKVVLR
jgi:membrane fusion protein (multidrug efflux system)